MYKTVPIKAKLTDEQQAFWVYQCEQANSLINCALYYARQNHYTFLEQNDNAFTVYWRGDDLRHSCKTYKCKTTYLELDKALKDNPHYKAMAAQSAQQTLKSVGESISSYNRLVEKYYKGEVDKPSLPKYRKRGELASVTFPRQALTYREGCFYPSISRETKPFLKKPGF